MRRILDILLTAIALLALAGCGDSLGIDGREDGDGESAGLTFSVTVPEAGTISTKSFSSEAISSLWVLAFDDQGFFVECQKAEPVNPTSFSTDENTEYEFKVKLQASITKRTLHFVANYDFSSNPVSYGTEYSVMRDLTVSGGQDAYWQKLELKDGIRSQEELDVMTADDLTKYYNDNGFKAIPLVRNFAKVSVVNAATDFELLGYALWNVPDRGCVAPCVASHNAFAVYAKSGSTSSLPNNPWISRSYDELKASYDGTADTGFEGYLPGGTEIIDTDASKLSFSMADGYMYERPYSGDLTNSAIIVKGSYKGNAATYYKVDFVQAADAGMMTYYNIIRNFVYKVTIKSCSADGYATAAEAAAAPASNNFVSSVVTQDIVNISDGTSRLNVSYTDTTVVNANAFTFRYKYIPAVNAPTVINNDLISTYDKATGKALAENGSVIKSWVSEDNKTTKWRVATIFPQTPGDEEKTQTVIFYEPQASGTNVKIARTVTFHLRKPYTMALECSPATVSSGIGQTLTLNIKIPTGLASHLFPLEFKMESAANSLTPDVSKSEDTYKSGYMSTWYGASIIPDGSTSSSGSTAAEQTFGFSKTLSYAEYQALASTADKSYKILPCAFKTTKASSATTVWVYNKYFNFGSGLSTVSFSN